MCVCVCRPRYVCVDLGVCVWIDLGVCVYVCACVWIDLGVCVCVCVCVFNYLSGEASVCPDGSMNDLPRRRKGLSCACEARHFDTPFFFIFNHCRRESQTIGLPLRLIVASISRVTLASVVN